MLQSFGRPQVHRSPLLTSLYTTVKERWDRKTVANLFAEEFRQRPLEYYHEAIEKGRILVNGRKVRIDHVVRSSQTLSHFVHRHEPPVMGEMVEILDLNPDVVTVWKPASVPVHPCGQYRKNTVLGILEAEQNLGPLYPIHRLDRLVSGLLILARNAHTADRFRQEIEGGKVEKSYVAKVIGVFPSDEVELNASIAYDPREGRSSVEATSKTLPNDPIGGVLCQSEKKSVGKGKDACTKFRRLSTNGVLSIVECTPLTGRTHQIRAHLQYLGHPIANDALYASHNPPKRTEAHTNAERAARLEIPSQDGTPFVETSSKRRRTTEDGRSSLEDNSNGQISVMNDKKIEKEGNSVLSSMTIPESALSSDNRIDFVMDPLCTHCPKLWPSGYQGKEHGLWLHCKSYSSKDWRYECPLPSWAREPSKWES